MSERGYYWTDAPNGEYEILFRPDGTEVTTITEPEDRNFVRDLAPVCVELNDLQAENARLREQAEALKAAILDIDAHSTAMGEDGDGFITGGYIVTVGSLHRALGAVGHTARKCSHEARCPTCAQADALAEALDLIAAGECAMAYGHPEEPLCCKAHARAALRAYREATP